MHIKHLKHGKGRAAKALQYLLHDTKAAKVEVVLGDPAMVAQVADSMTTKWKYTSGVIAWHPNDIPSDEQIKEVLKGYEELCFAGLAPEHRCISAIKHTEEDGSVHIHTFMARKHLGTGYSYNPVPPKFEYGLDNLRDYLNAVHNWKSPGDPSRRKLLSAGDKNMPKQSKEIKEALTSGLSDMATRGEIKSRNDVVSALKSNGFNVVRETEKSISIANPNGQRNIRLAGKLYERTFRFSNAIRRESEQNEQYRRRYTKEGVSETYRNLKATFEKRKRDNQIRYRAFNEQYNERLESLPKQVENPTNKTNNRLVHRYGHGVVVDVKRAICDFRAERASNKNSKPENIIQKENKPREIGKNENRIRQVARRCLHALNRISRAIIRTALRNREQYDRYNKEAVRHSEAVRRNAKSKLVRKL